MKRALIRRFPRIWRLTRLARRWYYARWGAYPDWTRIPGLDALRRVAPAARPARVLMASSIGATAHAVSIESALAASLTLRGAEVHVLLCDGALPACAECEASFYPDIRAFAERGPSRDLCRDCAWPAERVYRDLGLRVHRYSEYLTAEDRAEAARVARTVPASDAKAFAWNGLPVGEHALAGALRFFASGSLDGEPQGEAVLRRYLEAAILTAMASGRLFGAEAFDSVVVTHGIYVPWGILSETARRAGARVSTWNVAYRKRRFIFSHDDTYHHTLLSEPRDAWEGEALGESQERELLDYLASRREGLFDWIVFHRAVRQQPEDLARQLHLDPSRPIIGLLTNVSWDAQLHYPANAFPSMLDWLVETCEYFATRPDLQLLIRVHPAEVSGFPPSRQPILAELAKRVPHLSPNIVVVPPDSGMSSYTLMALCNAAIIYGTKMGVELTSVGLPVIVAGEAWIRNKGLTHDATSREDYRALLDRLPFAGRMDEKQVTRARRYAHHFFFNRMIPVPFVEPKAGYPLFRLRLAALDALAPGASAGLDTICDGILQGRPYVFGRQAGARAAAPTGA